MELNESAASVFNPAVYSQLLAVESPRAIRNDQELEAMAGKLEALDFMDRPLTPEEEAYRDVLAALVEAYDQTCEFPEAPPNEMVKFFMDQRGLKQADLVPLLGSRAQVSDVVTGKRGISKAQAKKLAAFFNTGVELFI